MYNPEYGMPYETDVNQYETEEERRRRLALEQEQNTPVKQTITTDPVTGAQKVKIEGSAYNLSSANPATPTVSAPVDPADIYNRMIQAESGGRQFAPNGQVLTSPKGAMGVGQVMPATAMQPGYGVTNIFDLAQQRGMPVAQRDEATARQLLGNESLNRDFGQSYFNAMQQRFPGDPAASVAAYNAGPGRVGQNMQANAGQLNRGQLPAETQAYLQQTLGGQPQPVSASTPTAQPIINDQGQILGYETPDQIAAGIATNAPVAPVNPAQIPTQPVSQPAAPTVAMGASEQMGPPTSAMTPQGWVDRFNSAKNDLGTMTNMLADPNLPPGARMEIAATMADQMRFQKQEAEAKDKAIRALESGNLRELERQDKKMGGEGSWLRYIMYGLLGSPNAQLEKDKLFPEMTATTKTFMLDDGTQGYMRVGRDGTPLRGGTEDGRQLTQKELIKYAQTGLGKGTSLSSEVYVDKNTGQRYRSGFDSSGATAMLNVQGGAAFRGDPRDLVVQSIGTAIAKAEGTKAVDLRYTGPIAYTKAGADFAGQFNAENGTNIGYQTQQPGAPLVDLNTGQPIVPRSNGTITATTTAPAPAVAGATTGMTPAQIRTQTAVGEATQKVFAEKRIPEIIDEGDAGGSVARIRREQLDVIRDNPSILGIYQGRGTDYDRARNVITNVISGAYGAEDSGKLRDDLKAISISPAEKAALENFANLNMQLNAKTLKANTGGGQISGAEQKINKETNLSEIASQTSLASMQGLHRSMFVGDLNSARAGFLTANPDLNTDAKFAAAWNREKSQANKAYEGIMRERAEFLRGYVPPRNPTAEQYAKFNERVFKAFEMFPAPRWDSERNKWDYQTPNAERAAARALVGR
jgi:hypothetical protein